MKKFLPLIFVFILNGWALYSWSQKDTRPLAWDESIHTRVAMDYQTQSALKPAYFNYPPLYHITLKWAFPWVDDIAHAGAFINFFYMALLCLAVFLVGHELFGLWPAFTASFLVSSYPALAYIARYPMIDLALAAWVTAAFYCLLKSEKFDRLRWSLLFGVALGFGLLTKWTALAYLLGPLTMMTWLAVRAGRWKTMGLTFLSVVLIAGPWYAVNVVPMLTRIVHVSNLNPAAESGLKGVWTLFYYPFTLFEQIYLIFFLLFIPGVVAVFWKPKLWPLLAWVLVSFILFSLIRNHNLRYSIPVLPAVALLSVSWLPDFRRIPYIVLNTVIFIFFILYQFFPTKVWAIAAGPVRIPVFEGAPSEVVDWKHGAIIERVMECGERGKLPRVVVVSNHPYFHSQSMNITSRSRYDKSVFFKGPSKKRWVEFASFVLLKTGDIGPTFEPPLQPSWFHDLFKEVGRWDLPDGSQAVLLQAQPKAMQSDIGVLNIELKEFRIPNIIASGLSLKVIPLSSADTAVGRVKEIELRSNKVEYKGIVFENVRIQLNRPQVNIPLFMDTRDIELLSLEKLTPTASVASETLVAYAAKKAKWLKDPDINFDGERIVIMGKVASLPVRIEAVIFVTDGFLKTRLERLTVLKIPIPLFMVRAVTDRVVSLSAAAERPYALGFKAVNGREGRLHLVAE